MKKEIQDSLKAFKRKAREEEIAAHGKLISFRSNKEQSKKQYSRSNEKIQTRRELNY